LPGVAGLRSGSFEAIVDLQGRRVGLVEVTNDGAALTIRHLELLPSSQGQGVGTAVIEHVVERAKCAGRVVELRVLHVNPRARALYERLGFAVVAERSTSTEMRLDPTEGQ
jgi:ribosomal protein S18 acetylase RimI-like enzyme